MAKISPVPDVRIILPPDPERNGQPKGRPVPTLGGGITQLPDCGGGDEEVEGVVLVDLAGLDVLLHLPHLLFPVVGKAQLILVRPKDGWPCSGCATLGQV